MRCRLVNAVLPLPSSRSKKNFKFRVGFRSCLLLDANRWMREGILAPGSYRSGLWIWKYRGERENSVSYAVSTMSEEPPYVRLTYTMTRRDGQKLRLDYQVELTTSRPNFGGLRWWFICPLVINGRACKRRVGKLHLPPGARYFGCRDCHQLTYTSCQESRKWDGLARLLARDQGWEFADAKRIMRQIGKRD